MIYWRRLRRLCDARSYARYQKSEPRHSEPKNAGIFTTIFIITFTIPNADREPSRIGPAVFACKLGLFARSVPINSSLSSLANPEARSTCEVPS